MPLILALLFLSTALLYASVGFGGGSTYNALLVLYDTPYQLIPIIALSCNIVVVGGSSWHFIRLGHIPYKRLTPFIAGSIPAAWLGGMAPINETSFMGLLGACLFASALALFLTPSKFDLQVKKFDPFLALITGIILGLAAGIVGIGGGIFLAPILYFLRWGSPREIAAACALFILLNSIAGIIGQTIKLQDMALIGDAMAYWPLLPAVFVGGQFGVILTLRHLPLRWIRRLTALLILYVASRLLYEWFAIINDWQGIIY